MTEVNFLFLRTSVLCLMISIASIKSVAQLKYGMKAGLNLSDVVINNVSNPDFEYDYKMKTGFHGGFFATADAEEFGLGAEILYSNKGVKAVGTNIRLHYISIPILLRYHFGERWVAEAGPEISYLVTANSKYGNVSNTWDNKIDVGIDAGVQHELNNVTVGARFNAGFSSVIRNPPGATGDNGIRYQNRVLQFFLSYKFGEAFK